MEVILAYTFV